MSALQTCDTCYELTFPDCQDMVFDLGLTPASEYYVIITDKFGNEYYDQLTVDASGSLIIDPLLYVQGSLFTPFSGSFTLTIKEGLVYSDLIEFTIDSISYNCVIFSIYHSESI